RVVVASRAPLARLRPEDRLHVLDRLPIELVVERREMMDRALPLLVDVLVALAARRRVHEEIRRDDAADVRLRRRREERRRRSTSLSLHRQRRRGWIDDAARSRRI